MFPLLRTLLEKLEDTRKSGHYVAARVSKQTTTDLKKWCKDNNVPVSSDFFDNLHITICYSTDDFPINDTDMIGDISTWSVKPISFAEFGKEADKKYLVLTVKCPQATKRWQHYLDLGASYGFDDYQPHLSLALNFPGDLDELDLDTLPKIVLAAEYYEKLDD
jgi:hypothetical protein